MSLAETAHRVLIPPTLAPIAAPRPGAVLARLGGATMGTSWSVRYAAPRHGAASDAARLLAGIEARLERVIAQMSNWRADSTISRFNRLPEGESLLLPPECRSVLRAALEIAEASGGAFDPTIGALVSLWGFGPLPAETEGPPPTARLEAARMRAGWRRLGFDPATGRVVQPGGLCLDLCGIAKGFAVDLLAEWLEAAGIESYLVEIGGELRGQGVKPDGMPWWVAVERPPQPGAPPEPCVVALHGLAIATSGDHRRCFRHDGRVYGHSVDPRSGWPASGAIASVTVLDPSCMRADALATAITVLGPQAGPDFAARHGVAALILRREEDGSLRELLTPRLAAMLE